MIEARQQAYLEAMNIPVWVERDQSAYIGNFEETVSGNQQAATIPVDTASAAPLSQEAKAAASSTSSPALSPGLKLGPGAGGVMLICAKDSDSASKMANDISRALGKMPVWGWPDNDEQAISPGDAVDENLFTCVAVFGEALGRLMFGNEIPAALGSAKLVMLPSMSELVSKASARRELWSVLCRSGMIVS